MGEADKLRANYEARAIVTSVWNVMASKEHHPDAEEFKNAVLEALIYPDAWTDEPRSARLVVRGRVKYRLQELAARGALPAEVKT